MARGLRNRLGDTFTIITDIQVLPDLTDFRTITTNPSLKSADAIGIYLQAGQLVSSHARQEKLVSELDSLVATHSKVVANFSYHTVR